MEAEQEAQDPPKSASGKFHQHRLQSWQLLANLPPFVAVVIADDAAIVTTRTVIEAVGPDEEVGDLEREELDDSSLGESTSLTPSIYEHTYSHGRRYHKYRSGRYPLPNDDDEQNREDMKHVMMLELTDGKLFFAPIGDHPHKIIDLGTGTGIWAIEGE